MTGNEMAYNVNKSLVDTFGVPMKLKDDMAQLETLDINIEPGDFPRLVCCYTIFKPLKPPLTAQDTYDKVYKEHYKFLTQNHMSKDRSERLATLYAVKNTWRIHNRNNKPMV